VRFWLINADFQLRRSQNRPKIAVKTASAAFRLKLHQYEEVKLIIFVIFQKIVDLLILVNLFSCN